jgi:hypothetical protein
MPSSRDTAHGGVLCTFSTGKSANAAAGFARLTAEQPQTRATDGTVRQAAWTVHHNTKSRPAGSRVCRDIRFEAN